MKIVAIGLLLLALSSQATASFFKENVSLIVSPAVKYKVLSFEQFYPTGLGEQFPDPLQGEIDVQLPMTSLSAYLEFNDRVSLSFSFETTLSETGEKSNVPFTNPATNPVANSESHDTFSRVDRTDFNFTVTYRPFQHSHLWKNTHFLIGYLSGETLLQPTPMTAPSGRQNLAQLQFNNHRDEYWQAYQEEGLYVGVYRFFPITDISSLSLMLAYADMNGLYVDNYYVANEAFEFRGDTRGVNAALTFSSVLTGPLNYSIVLSGQSYDMEGVDVTGFFRDDTVKTQEKMLSVLASLQWKVW